MKHYGDITKLSGWTLPIVDVITGGSPCQDLSVAGLRAGLAGERSGLFMEQIRIVKEMRERDRKQHGRTDEFCRPRFMVWENVPGAFSSNGGRDFQAVLTEIARIAEPDAPDVPLPDKGGWSKSGLIYGEMGNWSLAWRVHDAQFWGVPQRRKRICVLADFGGLAAPEILFDPQLERTTEDGDPVTLSGHPGTECRPEVQTQRESLSWDSAEGGAAREGATDPAGGGAKNPSVWVYGISSDQSNAMLSANPHSGIYEADTARTLDLNGGSPACNQGGMEIVSIPEIVNTLPARMDGSPCIDRGPPFIAVYDARGRGDGKIVPTMEGDHFGHISDYTALCVGNGQLNQMSMEPVSNTLDTMHDQQAVLIAYSPEVAHALKAKANLQFREDSETYIVAAVDCRNATMNEEVNGTLQAKEQGQNLNSNNVILIWPEVRRLTPLECTRLQGFPDGWLDIGDWTDGNGKLHKCADSPKYKAAGNSIALPFWQWLARRICAQYERPITMASLFDGIGGFPLAFSRCGATPIWASEIEEYPMAVTRMHFPEEEQ